LKPLFKFYDFQRICGLINNLTKLIDVDLLGLNQKTITFNNTIPKTKKIRKKDKLY